MPTKKAKELKAGDRIIAYGAAVAASMVRDMGHSIVVYYNDPTYDEETTISYGHDQDVELA